jgi:hypothetical protein
MLVNAYDYDSGNLVAEGVELESIFGGDNAAHESARDEINLTGRHITGGGAAVAFEIVCAHADTFRSRSCGVNVCHDCGHHERLVRCFCGWAASGGNGRAELVELGETIDPDE